MSHGYATAPDHVSACDLGPATVLVNYRTGGVHTLLGPSAQWWAELAATGDPSTPTALDSQSAGRVLRQLRAAGLLIDTATAEPWPLPITGQPWGLSFGTQEIPAGRTPIPPVPYPVLAVAGVALMLTVATRHGGRAGAGMARLLRLLRWAAGRTVRPATPKQAQQAVYAVRRAGLLAPGRVACLEESTAVVVTLAISRRRVTWCHGVAADPIRLHAWVETDNGHPVAEPASTLKYTPLRIIPAATTKGDD